MMEFAALLSPDDDGTEAFVVFWKSVAQEITPSIRQNVIIIFNRNDFMLGFHFDRPCENVFPLQIASQNEFFSSGRLSAPKDALNVR